MINMDMHCHTVFSDGKLQPSEKIREAKSKGLDVISITDHNTVWGNLEAGYLQRLNRQSSPVVIPGMEIEAYTMFNGQRRELEILAYGGDPVAMHQALFHQPNEVAYRVLQKLQAFYNQDIGAYNSSVPENRRVRTDLTSDSLPRELVKYQLNRAFEESDAYMFLSRMHHLGHNLTRFLMERVAADPNTSPSWQMREADVYERFGNIFEPGDFQLSMRLAEHIIEHIHHLGGLAFLSHPSRWEKDYMDFMPTLLPAGLDGVDLNYHADTAMYGKNKPHFEELCRENEEIKRFAKAHNLLFFYSSDAHQPGMMMEVEKIPGYEDSSLVQLVRNGLSRADRDSIDWFKLRKSLLRTD